MSKVAMFRVRAIAKKEVIEFVRDWRTIMAIIVIHWIGLWPSPSANGKSSMNQ